MTCDDVVVELEDFSRTGKFCSSARNGWACGDEGRTILWPRNAWINSSESSSAFEGEGSWESMDCLGGTFSISVVTDACEKKRNGWEFFKNDEKIFIYRIRFKFITWSLHDIFNLIERKQRSWSIKNWIFILYLSCNIIGWLNGFFKCWFYWFTWLIQFFIRRFFTYKIIPSKSLFIS